MNIHVNPVDLELVKHQSWFNLVARQMIGQGRPCVDAAGRPTFLHGVLVCPLMVLERAGVDTRNYFEDEDSFINRLRLCHDKPVWTKSADWLGDFKAEMRRLAIVYGLSDAEAK